MAAHRILYVSGGILDRGGITTYMMNYYRHFDRDLLQLDFVVQGGEGPVDDEVVDLGGRIYHVPTKRESLTGNTKGLLDAFDPGRYRVVHAHTEGMNGWVLKLAKQRGIPVRISHSHNVSHLSSGALKRFLHNRVMRTIPGYATHLWACSRPAGEWLYGKNREFTVIPNAIDTNGFRYRPESREQLRVETGIGDRYAIGVIGRLESRKNQEFLIRLLPKLVAAVPDVVLVLAGEGTDRIRYEALAESLGTADRVVFAGERTDIPLFLNALDLVAMPSLFEGLGIAAVEAQANGLHVLASEFVPEEVNLSGEVEFLPLQEEKWMERIAACRTKERIRDGVKRVSDAGYDIVHAAKALQDRYLALPGEET